MPIDREQRTTEQGQTIDVTLARNYLTHALSHDAVVDRVNELLHDHVVAGRYHRSVVAESLKPIITELLEVTTFEDWQAVADELIAVAQLETK